MCFGFLNPCIFSHVLGDKVWVAALCFLENSSTLDTPWQVVIFMVFSMVGIGASTIFGCGNIWVRMWFWSILISTYQRLQTLNGWKRMKDFKNSALGENKSDRVSSTFQDQDPISYQA